MNKAIHFKTSFFDVSKEPENPINPIYGISFLQWLKNELSGMVQLMEPDAEDWGWYSELEWEGNSYLIGAVAHADEKEDPNEEIEWVFQVDKIRTFKEKMFGKNKMSEIDSCVIFFKELIEANPNFTSVEVI